MVIMQEFSRLNSFLFNENNVVDGCLNRGAGGWAVEVNKLILFFMGLGDM